MSKQQSKKIDKTQFFLLRDFGYAKLIGTSDGRFFLCWILTRKQQKYYGQKISPFTCYRQEKLCGKILHRVHITCFVCKLRKVVEGIKPFMQQIQINQIWIEELTPHWRRKLIKNLIRLTEYLS